MGQYGFYFDSAKCTGCKTCQVACKENYHLPAHNLFRRVYHYAGGSWELVSTLLLIRLAIRCPCRATIAPIRPA